MKKCKFNYRPTFIYLYSCESIEDLKAQKFEYFGESDYNSTGTIEYNITVRKKVIFKYRIPVNHIEEEDLKIDELEGKILIREINVYSHQSIDAFYDEEETNFEPCSVYFGLAYNFNGVTFNDEEDEFENDELEEYVPRDGEVAEQYFEYFLINNGNPKEIYIE
jgi:hypothetical protein